MLGLEVGPRPRRAARRAASASRSRWRRARPSPSRRPPSTPNHSCAWSGTTLTDALPWTVMPCAGIDVLRLRGGSGESPECVTTARVANAMKLVRMMIGSRLMSSDAAARAVITRQDRRASSTAARATTTWRRTSRAPRSRTSSATSPAAKAARGIRCRRPTRSPPGPRVPESAPRRSSWPTTTGRLGSTPLVAAPPLRPRRRRRAARDAWDGPFRAGDEEIETAVFTRAPGRRRCDGRRDRRADRRPAARGRRRPSARALARRGRTDRPRRRADPRRA